MRDKSRETSRSSLPLRIRNRSGNSLVLFGRFLFDDSSHACARTHREREGRESDEELFRLVCRVVLKVFFGCTKQKGVKESTRTHILKTKVSTVTYEANSR